MPFVSSAGLLCVNDYINTVTCAWLGSARPPGSNCSISAVKNIWIVEKLQRKRGQMMYVLSVMLIIPARRNISPVKVLF